jgi:hypothetical protein
MIAKIVRIGKIEDQDEFRREDIRKMSPDQRVQMLLDMQAGFLNWTSNPRIERTARLKRINFRNLNECVDQ